MEAVGRRPLVLLTRRRLISGAVVVMSCTVTATMSLIFNGSVRPDMMVTGFFCALICDHLVRRVTRHYRRQLVAAHEQLELRVRERTAELETANHALMVSDRMATAGKLAAGVSHEIRTPLQVICLATEEIQTFELAPDVIRERISDIAEAAARITTVARDLSSLARPIDDPLGAVAVTSVIASASRLASYQRRAGISLECPSPSESLRVVGSEPRLVQVLLNLIVNAMRATRDDAPNTVRVTAARNGDHVELVVGDTGCGMPPEVRARIFEPFFTTGAARGGTGLGLTICKTLVERMGGTIDIASVPRAGTTVTVMLRAA